MSNPQILWAQDRDTIFITLEIVGLTEPNVTFQEKEIHFIGKTESQEYDYSIHLHRDINVNTAVWKVYSTGLKLTLEKIQKRFWNRLTQHKQNNIKIDWQKWINEEDEESDDSDDNDSMLRNFNDFKKTLPSELLEKDFTELIPDDNQEITDEELESVTDKNKEVVVDNIETVLSEDDGFIANGEETSLYEESNEENNTVTIQEDGTTELEVEELDVSRLDVDVDKELDMVELNNTLDN